MSSVDDMTSQAGFVFEGEVEQMGASTSSGFAPTPDTAIVRISKILKSTPSLAGYAGQQVTVQMEQPATLQTGQQATFFTHGIHFGEGVVVNAFGSSPAGDPATQSLVENATQSASDTELTQRLAQADLVVSGVAAAPSKMLSVTEGVISRPISEHDPDWWQATINVNSVEKGEDPGPTTTVIFPHSIDIAWYRSPKVKEGDSGVWLLHNRDLFGRSVPARAIVHPLDFQPTTALDHVRSLMKPSQ